MTFVTYTSCQGYNSYYFYKAVHSEACSDFTDHVFEENSEGFIEENVKLPRYFLKQDYISQFGGEPHKDWIVKTPVLDFENTQITPHQAEATLDYFVSCGERLTQMTKTYHDVEAVTQLLEEKEKDLELAAKIGQELLQRNKESDERVIRLEAELNTSNELIVQLRHELQVKTDLLHVYNNDLEDASPLEFKSFNVELMQKKILDLEEENKTLHDEASKLAQEAFKCEEKEEKLVKDAVQHLTQANSQIKDLHHQFTHKIDESAKQREEINRLLSQVCDLQKRLQNYSHENDDLTSNLRVYQETQDELTSELLDLKEKYKEVVNLLRDANEEIRKGQKTSYPGVGRHSLSDMFTDEKSKRVSEYCSWDQELSKLHPSSNVESHSACSEDTYKKAENTLRAISKPSDAIEIRHKKINSYSTRNITQDESVFQSYTISRENSFSPDSCEFQYFEKKEKVREETDMSEDSGTGRSTGFSQSGSLAGSVQMDENMMQRSSRSGAGANTSDDVEYLEIQTVGQLKPPSLNLSSTLFRSTPLGHVPGSSEQPGHFRQNNEGLVNTVNTVNTHPGLGLIPHGGSTASLRGPTIIDSDYDETEPLESLTFNNISGKENEHLKKFCDLDQGSDDIYLKEVTQGQDSGMISGDFPLDSTKKMEMDILSEEHAGIYPKIRSSSDSLNDELEKALKYLNPDEVERRRNIMGQKNSYDLLGDERLESPGALASCEDYFRNLPYSLDYSPSTSSLRNRNSYYQNSCSRRLPDKLRIVKPLEGSLTLHNWSKLATPHLGGVLEERCGVAIKGSDKAGLDPLFEMYNLETEMEDCNVKVPAVKQFTNTNFTFTNSTVLHPDTTYITKIYPNTQLSSGLPSRNQSRLSSRCSSFTSLSEKIPHANLSNIGLVKLLSEKKISSARKSQLDLSFISSVSSLTPSVLNSPFESKEASPTFTPPHTPERSSSPELKVADDGYVSSFISSLKAAIYGQQRKETRSKQLKQDKKYMLDRIDEDKEGTPQSLPPLSVVENKRFDKSGSLSDFDVRYLGVLDDFDELEDIKPGLLTISQTQEADVPLETQDPHEYTKNWIGQLSVPCMSAVGRPSLAKKELGKIPASTENFSNTVGTIGGFGGRGPGRVVSPGEIRPYSSGLGLGVPGHPGTGAVMNALETPRPDLGTVPCSMDPNRNSSDSFIGSITNILFSRKGGY